MYVFHLYEYVHKCVCYSVGDHTVCWISVMSLICVVLEYLFVSYMECSRAVYATYISGFSCVRWVKLLLSCCSACIALT